MFNRGAAAIITTARDEVFVAAGHDDKIARAGPLPGGDGPTS